MRSTPSRHHGVRRWAWRSRQIRVLGARVSRLIATSGVVGFLACAEATSPETAIESDAPTAGPAAPAPSSQLQAIGSTLVDATDWVLVVMTDESARLKMKSAIGALAEHLVAGRNSEAKEEVAGLRAALASLDDLAPALGPIGVALDQIDHEFEKLPN